MRIVIFGVGEYLKKRYARIKTLFSEGEIVAFIDNKIRQDQTEWFDGIQVVNPMSVKKLKYDYIAIASKYYNEMKQQLLEMEVDSTKVISLEKCCGLKNKGILKLNIVSNDCQKKRLLIISVDMNYNGASLAIVYAAKEINKKIYEVTVVVPSIQQELLLTLTQNKINVIVCPSLPYIDHAELYWMKNYDIAIVNTLQNIQVVCELCNIIPVLWWVHEFGKKYKWIYDNTRTFFDEYKDGEKFSKVRIAAVSQWAADVFNHYYPQRVNTILPVGIPDEAVAACKKEPYGKIKFAVIGGLNELKAQDLVIEAIYMLPIDILMKATFYIIGSNDENRTYTAGIKEKAVGLTNVIFTGVLERRALWQKLSELDVIVCSSREETLSIAIIEGMMNSKICITTDATGVAEFMEDGVNGFIVRSDDVTSLAEKIKHVICNISDLDNMRKAARAVYDKYFNMQVFGDRLEKEIGRTINEYKIR